MIERDKYITMLAHDLRVSVTGVIGGLSLIRRDALDDEMSRALNDVEASANMLSQLVEDELDRAVMESGDRVLKQEPVEISSLAEKLLGIWRPQAIARQQSFAVRVEDTAPGMIWTDPDLLTRVLNNLASNAVNHSGWGKIELRISRDEDGTVNFCVCDDGRGIPDEDRLAQFKSSLDGTGAPLGPGRGLYIIGVFSKQLGGEVKILSSTDEGCRICVTLPASCVIDEAGTTEPGAVAQNGAAGDRQERAAPARTGLVRPEGVPDLSGLRILMAEDNITNQHVAGKMLEVMGADVTIVPDGAVALEVLEVDTFDVILADIEMPRVSGLDVMRQVRASPEPKSGIPIIALTAYAMPEHRAKIDEAGADGFIAKPIKGLDQFGNAILDCVRKVESRRSTEKSAIPAVPEDDTGPEEDDVVSRVIYDALASTIGNEGMAELLEKVEEDLIRVKTGVADAAGTGDMQEMRAKTHVLISVAGAVGATGVQALAERANRASHNGDTEAVETLSREIDTGISKLIRFVRQERAAVSG